MLLGPSASGVQTLLIQLCAPHIVILSLAANEDHSQRNKAGKRRRSHITQQILLYGTRLGSL